MLQNQKEGYIHKQLQILNQNMTIEHHVQALLYLQMAPKDQTFVNKTHALVQKQHCFLFILYFSYQVAQLLHEFHQ